MEAVSRRHIAWLLLLLLLLLLACTMPCSYDLDSLSDEEGAAGKGHITNYAQNVNGTVWTLTTLKQHLGETVFGGWVGAAQ